MRLIKITTVFLIITLLLSHAIWVIHLYRDSSFWQMPQGSSVTLTGIVADLPHAKKRGMSFDFKSHHRTFLISWYGKNVPPLMPGQSWQLTLKPQSLPFYQNLGEFDYAHYLKTQGYSSAFEVIQGRYLAFNAWQEPINYLRAKLLMKISGALNSEDAPLLIALVLGDKSGLNDATWQTLNRTGTSYFFVISGLHIAILAMLGFFLIRYCLSALPCVVLNLPAQIPATLAAILFALVYSLLAGFSVPTERAFLMLIMMSGAYLLNYPVRLIQVYGFAFVLVVLINPFVIFNVGFWLSFLAVFLLIYVHFGRLGAVSFFEKWFYPQYVISLGLLPIIAFNFLTISLTGFAANLITCAPMILIITPLAVIGSLLLWVWPALAGSLLNVDAYLLRQVLHVLQFFARLPGANISVAQVSLALCLLGFAGVLLIFAPKSFPMRYLGWLMLLAIFLPPARPQNGQVKIDTLQVPQGSISILSLHRHIIINQIFLAKKGVKEEVKHILIPYLKSRGIEKIDLWVVDGPLDYHDIQIDFLSDPNIAVSAIQTPHAFKIYNSQVGNCLLVSPWVWDGVQFSYLKKDGCQLVFNKSSDSV